MRPGPTREIIDRIESIEGCPITEIVHRKYIEERLSYRQLCVRWRINNRTIMRLLRHLGIAPRKGGDAIKAQWEHAPQERRQRAGQKFRESLSGRQHPRLGKTKQNDEGTRRAAEKLKTVSSLFRDDVRRAMNEGHKRFIAEHPRLHATEKRSITTVEWLTKRHIEGLGIECEHCGRFPLSWERHCALSAIGIRLTYITNPRVHRGLFGGLDKYIAIVKLIATHPTAHRENTVIWGRVNEAVFEGQPDDAAVEKISVDSGNTLLITTSADDPVAKTYRLYGLPAGRA